MSDQRRWDGLRFGTGGIRCLMGAGLQRMNTLTIGQAAQGLANWLETSGNPKPVAIGYDTRHQSAEFAQLVASVLASSNIRSLLFDSPQPTPVLDYAVRKFGCSAGVVITASHNPREYNGFKVYGSDGVQATDSMARSIQACIEQVDPFNDVRPQALDVALQSGLVRWIGEGFTESYLASVLGERLGTTCTGLGVVYSPLCGTGLGPAQQVLERLDTTYSVVEEQRLPDPDFTSCPTPNPESPQAMALGIRQMQERNADIFLATDPDADRLGVACMHHGVPRLLTGDEVGLLLFDHLCRTDLQDLSSPVAVTTIVTSPLADSIAHAHDVELRRTLTGFKYVGEQVGRIEAEGRHLLLGFEESCGYLKGSYVRDKDGICSLMLLCELTAYHKSQGRTLVEALESIHEHYGHVTERHMSKAIQDGIGLSGDNGAQTRINRLRHNPPSSIAGLPVVNGVDYSHGTTMPTVGAWSQQILPQSDVLEWQLEGGSKVIVRPSGTEPKIKAYVFAAAGSKAKAETLLNSLCIGVQHMLCD